MEQILGVLFESLKEVYSIFFDGMAWLLAGLFGSIFDTEIEPEAARPAAILVVFLLTLYLLRKFLFVMLGSEASKPMKVTHTTDKTPAQVVSEDLQKKLMALLAFGGVCFALYVFGTAP